MSGTKYLNASCRRPLTCAERSSGSRSRGQDAPGRNHTGQNGQLVYDGRSGDPETLPRVFKFGLLFLYSVLFLFYISQVLDWLDHFLFYISICLENSQLGIDTNRAHKAKMNTLRQATLRHATRRLVAPLAVSTITPISHARRWQSNTHGGPIDPVAQGEMGVGELEGASFKIEPLRRTGEDADTMRARLTCMFTLSGRKPTRYVIPIAYPYSP